MLRPSGIDVGDDQLCPRCVKFFCQAVADVAAALNSNGSTAELVAAPSIPRRGLNPSKYAQAGPRRRVATARGQADYILGLPVDVLQVCDRGTHIFACEIFAGEPI